MSASESFSEDTFVSGGNKLSVPRNMSFFDYITSFTTNEKSQLLNLLQYGGLATIPLLIVLKLMTLYVPEQDPYKSTTELLIEVVTQLAFIVVFLFFIHKLVLYVPTYSQVEYDNISLLSGILPLFFLILTFDSKISQKATLLFDRLLFAIGLKKEPFEENIVPKTTSQEAVQMGDQTQMNHGIEDRLGVLPTKREPGHEMHAPPQQSHQLQGGMDTMDNGAFVDDQGPMPANSMLGGSLF